MTKENLDILQIKPKAYHLQIVIQNTLPRMKQATNDVSEDLPLFIVELTEDDMPMV
jgi:hypothetical protein